MANSDIKVTNLECYKVGTDDCEVYLGTTKLYPLTPPAPETQYLTFNVLSDGTITWSGSSSSNTLSYSSDNGATWSAPSTSVTLNLNRGDTVMWKGTCTPSSDGIGFFQNGITATFNVYGNIMSLLFGDNFSGQTDLTGYDCAFSHLFKYCTNLINASNLILPATTLAPSAYTHMFYGCMALEATPALPATTLANYCYYYMFAQCYSLEAAPELPATTLATSCYKGMFEGCHSLVAAPELSATTLASNCYEDMFKFCTSLVAAQSLPATALATGCYDSMFAGCTSLTTAPSTLPTTTMATSACTYMFSGCTSLTAAPVLSATTLANQCYLGMFLGCSGLTTAPELPATRLANRCYERMFADCTSLTTAPELPAKTLAQGSYYFMFNGCTNLNSITCLATNISAQYCTFNWVSGVAASGTFIKDPSMTSWTRGINGIPVNWTIPAETEYTTFNITSSGDVTWSGTSASNAVSYSLNGSAWSAPSSSFTINANSGDTILLKGQCVPNSRGIGRFSGTTAQFDVGGNIMSLLYGDNFSGQTSLASYNRTFDGLFQTCTTLINAENLSLPATELGARCYASMFNACTELLTAPELPAATLADGCYTSMFATCQSLTTAPELPATTLVQYCYSAMFQGCASLTTAPTLSATALANYCYQFMFYGCNNLTSITCLATNITASQCTNQWAGNVSSTGTFTKNPSMTSWTTGDNGIPSGWTVQDYT